MAVCKEFWEIGKSDFGKLFLDGTMDGGDNRVVNGIPKLWVSETPQDQRPVRIIIFQYGMGIDPALQYETPDDYLSLLPEGSHVADHFGGQVHGGSNEPIPDEVSMQYHLF